jgi:hypothetical protein
MKALTATILISLFILSGCTRMMISQYQEKNAAGYGKVVKIMPECEQPPTNKAAGCILGAEMLDSKSPEKATTIFLKSWDNNVFGIYHKKTESAEMRMDLVETLVYSGIQRDAVMGMQTIAVPVLMSIYESNPSDYSSKMKKLLNIVEIDSRSSFDMFRDGHLKSIMDSASL